MLNLKAIAVSLALGLASIAHAAQPDLGDDIMKPMGNLLKQIAGDIDDGANNANTVDNIKKVEGYIDQALTVDPNTKALVLIPDTDNYKAEVALVGADLALKKYTSLLQALSVTMHEFEATVTNAKTAACGQPCSDKLNQIKEIEDVGHSVFKDSN